MLFGRAREVAGTPGDVVDGTTVVEVLEGARVRYGEEFGRVLDASRVWVNGDPLALDAPVGEADEVAVLPPVSGG